MPALTTVSLASTNSNKTAPTIINNYIIELKGSQTGQTALRSTSAPNDFYYTCTLPNNLCALMTNRSSSDLDTTTNDSIMSINGGIFYGTTQPLTCRMPNPQTGNDYTMESGASMGYLGIIQPANLKSTIPNPW